MVVALRVEIALHDILFVVPIVCACPAAWGVGNLHQTAAVEEEPCPSAVGSMSPGAVDLVEEKAFDRFRRLVSVEAAVFDFVFCSTLGSRPWGFRPVDFSSLLIARGRQKRLLILDSAPHVGGRYQLGDI